MESKIRQDVIRDNEFYMQHSIFLVEKRLFKVPILYLVEESAVFRAMFQLPQDTESGSPIDGTTDERPIVLEGLRSDDFKQLLRVLYTRKPLPNDALTLDQWGAVFRLSSKWDMQAIHKMAVQNMMVILYNDPHKLVEWGTRFHVVSWLSDGLTLLVQRLDPMTEADVEKIGVPITLKIALIREEVKKREVVVYQSLNSYVNRKIVKDQTSPETAEQIRKTVPLIFNWDPTTIFNKK